MINSASDGGGGALGGAWSDLFLAASERVAATWSPATMEAVFSPVGRCSEWQASGASDWHGGGGEQCRRYTGRLIECAGCPAAGTASHPSKRLSPCPLTLDNR